MLSIDLGEFLFESRVRAVRAKADFRLDAWWFGLLLLFRNLGFSAAIVMATDLAPAQLTIASVIMLVYCLAQAAVKPWKAPLINVMDACLSAGLLLLIRTSTQQDVGLEEKFAKLATWASWII